MTDLTIRPFEVHVPEEDLVDLRRRLAATRGGPATSSLPIQSRGVQLATIQHLVTYWGTHYGWHTCEAKLNALPQFTTEPTSYALRATWVFRRKREHGGSFTGTATAIGRTRRLSGR